MTNGDDVPGGSVRGGSKTSAAGVMAPVVAALMRVRSAARTQLVSQRTLWIIAAAVVAVLLLGGIDYLLRLPMPIRVLHLAVGLVVLVIWFKRSVVPALRFRPSLTDIALRLERSAPGKGAGLPGVLASGLEFAEARREGELSDDLSDRVAGEAARRYAAFARGARIFDRRLLSRAVVALLAAASPVALLGVLAPKYLRIGTERTLTPWAAVSWPKRTGVIDAGVTTAHAAGTALPLRALLVKTDRDEGKTDVTLAYRLIVDGKPQEERRVLMTPQRKRATADRAGVEVTGELFERLLDADAVVPAGAAAQPQTKVALEYWFRTSDDETEPGRVLIVQPPAVVSAKATVTPPAYAAAVLAAPKPSTDPEAKAPSSADWFTGERDVGPGSPQRGVVGPILAGSRVEFALRFNKPLPAIEQGPQAEDPAAWAGKYFPGIETASGVTAGTLADGTFVLGLRADGPMRVPVALRDEYGIASAEDSAFRLEVLEDHAPTVSVIDPPQDESVLATAVVGVEGEGRDDVAIRSVSLRRQTARPPAASVGAAPEALGVPEEMATAAPGVDGPLNSVRCASTLDLSELKLNPGDEVWLTAAGSDIYEFEGAARPAVTSAKRRLRIIAESELVEQVRAELSALREAAKRSESEQAKLTAKAQEAAASAQAASEMVQRQEALSERMRPMKEAVDRLTRRIERNKLGDTSLSGVLKDAGELVDQARQESQKASDALDRLGQPKPDRQNDPAIKKSAQELQTAQKQVEDDLSQLANMLDRGQDDWAVRRAIEKALTEQRQLRAQTQAAGRATQGKDSKDLDGKQREELDRLARQQQELSQRSRAMADGVRQRAQQMQQADPAQAQAMQSAANKAQQQQLAQKQQQASEQINQNKTGEAEQNQEQAEKTLESMLEELDKSQQHRDEALRRVLADVMQSLRKLIDQQQSELSKLADAQTGKRPAAGLDAGMIALQQNTLGVQTTVKTQMRGADVLLGVLSSAAEAQAASVVSLRATPPDQPEADANERVSLKRLQDALEEAKKLEDQAQEREEDRKRAELKKAYKELLELEVAVAADAAPLVGKEPDRRQRAKARELGVRQEEIRSRMAELRSKTSGVSEVKLFDYAHGRFDKVTGDAAKALSEGSAPASVGRDTTTAVRILQGLVQALDDAEKKKDDFKEEEGGGGDGGGGQQGPQPLIPPIAELRLLRAMQSEAMDRTRGIADTGDQLAPGELDAITRLQRDLADQARELLDKLNNEEKQPPPNQERN